MNEPTLCDPAQTIIHNLKMIESYSRKTAELIEEVGGKTDISNELESGARTTKNLDKNIRTGANPMKPTIKLKQFYSDWDAHTKMCGHTNLKFWTNKRDQILLGNT